VPLDIVERNVDQWIAAKKKAAAPKPAAKPAVKKAP